MPLSPAAQLAAAPPSPEAEAVELCSTCSHPMANHDTTGARYCAATLAHALTRGCICRPPR